MNRGKSAGEKKRVAACLIYEVYEVSIDHSSDSLIHSPKRGPVL